MVKLVVLVVAMALLVLEECCGQTLTCHFCLDGCDVSHATHKTCGQSIGSSHEAVCTTHISKESKTPSVAVRRCEVVVKGKEPTCEVKDICTSCKTDLCNSSQSIGTQRLFLGLLFTSSLWFLLYL